MKKITVIHGPNLNMLGQREPETYGTVTLDQINTEIEKAAQRYELKVDIFQSNYEGSIIEKIQETVGNTNGIIINPAAYTHTSIGIRDALLLTDVPIIEVHISNIFKRENFRRKSLISDTAAAVISGLGHYGYILAVKGIYRLIR